MVNKLVVENLKHRPVRTILTVVAIGLQVTLMLTIVGLTRGLLESSATRTKGVGADITIRPPGSSVMSLSAAPMNQGIVALVGKMPHVTQAMGTVVQNVGGFDTISGIDLNEFNRMSGGFTYLSGGGFQKQDDILIDEFFAKQRNLKVGDRVKLSNVDWTVRGIVGGGKLSRAFVSRSYLQELSASPNRVSIIWVKVDQPSNIAGVMEEIKAKLEGYPVFTMEEILSQFTVDNVPGVTPFIKVIIGLSIVFGFLVVFLAMYTAVLERTREIGILKALGASPTYIVTMLLRETVVLALIGALAGIVMTYAARATIIALVPASLPVVSVPDWWWRAGVISLCGAILGALYPGMKAARQDAIEALAYE